MTQYDSHGLDAGSAPISVTMGDPAGVGAEVIVKAAAELPVDIRRQFMVVGSTETLERAIKATYVAGEKVWG